MRRHRIWATLLLIVVGCEESSTSPEASLLLEFVAPQDVPAADQVVVHLEGPTSLTRTYAPGDSVGFDELDPGSYRVAVEGTAGDGIVWFGDVAIQIEEGAAVTRTVTARSFVPDEVTVEVEGDDAVIGWPVVQGAEEYRVAASGEAFGTEGFVEQGRTSETSLTLTLPEPGLYAVRVRAVNRLGNAGVAAEASVEKRPAAYPLTVTVATGSGPPVGTVLFGEEGCTDGETCTYQVPADSQAVLELQWSSWDGSSFGGWSGDCSGFDACRLTMDGPKDVVVTAAERLRRFYIDPWIGGNAPFSTELWISWNQPTQDCSVYIGFDLTNVDGSAGCERAFAPGFPLVLTSSEDVSWADGCVVSTPRRCEIEVLEGEGPQEIGANWSFEPPPGHRSLAVDYYGGKGGYVESDGPGIYSTVGIGCGTWWESGEFSFYCVAVYPEGMEVTLNATPVSGFVFAGWEGGGCSGTDPCAIRMEESLTVRPLFDPAPTSHPLTVTVEAGGGPPVGNVVVGDERCGDGEVCSYELPADSPVEVALEWVADGGGSSFGGWSGACSGFEVCRLTMDGPKEVVATTTEALRQFHIEPWIGGSGYAPYRAEVRVSWNQPSRDCYTWIGFDLANVAADGDCTKWFAPGHILNLTSSEDVTWPSSCGPSTPRSCTIEVVDGEGPQQIGPTWSFEPPAGHQSLEVDYYAQNGGYVESDVPGIYSTLGIECGSVSRPGDFVFFCIAVYPEGTEVTLTATPMSGYAFIGWEGGGCSGTGPCVVRVDESVTVRPVFEATEGASRTPAGRK